MKGFTLEKVLVAGLNLLDGIFVIVWSIMGSSEYCAKNTKNRAMEKHDVRDRDVSTINDLKARSERVDLQGNIIASVKGQASRTCTNARCIFYTYISRAQTFF